MYPCSWGLILKTNPNPRLRGAIGSFDVADPWSSEAGGSTAGEQARGQRPRAENTGSAVNPVSSPARPTHVHVAQLRLKKAEPAAASSGTRRNGHVPGP